MRFGEICNQPQLPRFFTRFGEPVSGNTHLGQKSGGSHCRSCLNIAIGLRPVFACSHAYQFTAKAAWFQNSLLLLKFFPALMRNQTNRIGLNTHLKKDVTMCSKKIVPTNIEAKQNTYFPTQIFSYNLEGETLKAINDPIRKAIFAERERDSEGIQRSNFRALGGWHSHNNLHKDEAYSDLVDLVGEVSASICEQNSYESQSCLKIGTMWSVINSPGSSNRAHVHPGCLWSGVYYVQAPEKSGNIEFTDPRTVSLMNPARYIAKKRRPKPCWTKVNFTPTVGRLLVFPSWLYHSVAPNLSQETGEAAERIIISFNLNQVKIK